MTTLKGDASGGTRLRGIWPGKPELSRKGDLAVTNYPNPGDRPEGIGAEDFRRTASTQDVTPAEELVPSSSEETAGTYSEGGVPGAFESSTSASYPVSATQGTVAAS